MRHYLGLETRNRGTTRILSIASAVILAVGAAPVWADDEPPFTNQAGNFVFPDHVFSTPGGINPKPRSTSGSGSGGTPPRINNLDRAKNAQKLLGDLFEELRGFHSFDEDTVNIFNAEVLLDALEVKIENASGGNLPFNFNSFTGGTMGVNRAGPLSRSTQRAL